MLKRILNSGYLLIVLGMLLTFENTLAQKELNFITLTTKNGLSSNTVNAILQDRQGLVWFATNDGLNKFDGTNFTVYTHNELDSTSMPSNVVTTLLEDRSGRLWIGTSGGGLAYFNPKCNSFVVLKSEGKTGVKTRLNVKSLYEDQAGRIWVGSFGGYRIIDPITLKIQIVKENALFANGSNSLAVLSFFEDEPGQMWIGTNSGLLHANLKSNKVDVFLHNASDQTSISDNCIRSISRDNHGSIFFGTTNGLNMLMPDGKHFKRFMSSDQGHSTRNGNIIYASALAPKGKLWLGTEDGVSIFDCENQTFSSIKPDARKSFSLSDKSIRSICIAKTGIVWLGTYQGGLNKFDPNLPLFNLKRSSPFDPRGLSSPRVTSFAEYRKGGLFVGTDGGGLHFFDRQTGLFDHVELKSELGQSERSLTILTMEIDRQKNLWIGTYQNGLFVYNPATKNYKQYLAGNSTGGISQNEIFFVKQDSRGFIWIGTNGNGVDVFDPRLQTFSRYYNGGVNKQKMPLNGFMRAIAEDNKGDVWLGSNGTGIAIFHHDKQNFTVYNKSNSELSEDVVHSILHDKRGNTWVGTNSGLNLFNPKTGKFIHFNEADGLANNFVYKILEDKEGLIWFSTDKGISCMDPLSKKIKNFGRSNGVQDSPFILGSGMVASDFELYFGGQDGFNYFLPSALPSNYIMPSVLLTELKVANNLVTPGEDSPIREQIGFAKQITLAYGQNFSISYVALNFTAPQQIHYAYRLVGLDQDWNNVGKEKTAYYTNLDPGDYTFQVRASNRAGVWNKSMTTILVRIHPPIWRSTFAYLLYTVLIVVLIFYARHRSIRKIENRLALEQEKINVQQQIEQHQREAERVQALNMQKIKFLTNLSHEFRTPISLILAPVDKLLSTKQDQSVSSQVKMIRRNVRRLLNLVNQLLHFKELEGSELQLNPEEGDLVGFIREAAGAFQDLSDRKRIPLYVHSHADSLWTSFDHDKMERIIFNLLSNAFKFTNEGGEIRLEMSLKEVLDGSKPMFDIAVSDTGIGISSEIREKVFERFFMENHVSSILNQGSGIGLSIVKEFVELHGGTITIDSTLGKGSVFLVCIPYKAVSPAPPTTNFIDLNQEMVADPKIATVLLVEDNEEFRYHLKDALKPYYVVIEAANGKEGWQKALSCHPQLVVSDISMPEMNGIELGQKIKSDKRTCHIPVILLTATGGEENQIKGLESGANDYLTKPFSFDILNAKIRNLLRYNRSVKDTYSKHVEVLVPGREIESTEVKLLNKIVQYIDEKLNNPELSVEDLSKHLGMSRGTLYHKLLEITGLTPIEYIRSIKLKRATELLEKSDYNVAQIAYMTGFGAPSYFSRLFKAQYHVLPSEYINMKRKDKSKIKEQPNLI